MSPTPIGLLLWQSARTTARAFETFLFDRDGSLSTWLILLALHETGGRLQTDLPSVVGIGGPTLTHHLNAMEEAGWIERSRTKDDRRQHWVSQTAAGRKRFRKLRKKARLFDAALREALSDAESAQFRIFLTRIATAAESVTAAQADNPRKRKPRRD